MAGLLGALIRQQRADAVNGEAKRSEPNPSVTMPANRYPAFRAGQATASELAPLNHKSSLPVPFVPPVYVAGEPMETDSAESNGETMARESDEPTETVLGARAEPIPAAPPSVGLGAFLKAARKAGVTVNVTVESKRVESQPSKEVDPLAKLFVRSEEPVESAPAVEEPETETGFVGRVTSDFRNRYGYDLHIPYSRIASYRGWVDHDMILDSLYADEMRLLPTEEQKTEWTKADEYLTQIERIEDDRDMGGVDDSVLADSGETGTDSYEYGSDESDGIESSDGAIDILSAPSIADGINFALDPSQEAAIIGLANKPCGCLIGAAGTGKTTTTKMLVNTLMYGSSKWGVDPLRLKPVDIRKYHERGSDKGKKKKAEESEANTIIPSIAMVAYTGQATQVLKKNMPKEWHRNVMTIHLLLGFAPTTYEKADGSEGIRFEPSYTKHNRMPWDVIIVDETSMVSVDLWHMLLDASKPGCRFYFIGDLNQLPPPIGAGVLGFALSKWPVYELTVVHRQADDTANRIVDTAHRILRGETPEFDNTADGPQWRVAGFKLEHSSEVAADQIIKLAYQLSKVRYPGEDGPAYDPWRDRIMVAMNGFNPDRPNYVLGQEPLNDSLSMIFAGKDAERVIINAKKAIKKFGVGYRVMATKNEPPNMENRVTNGLTGKIIAIEPNPKWTGDWELVGPEKQVKANRKRRMEQISAHEAMSDSERADSLGDTISNFRLKAMTPSERENSEEAERGGGPASHIVTVAFDNGGTREYRMNAQIEQLQIAYVSTVHKAQGAEMPLAIVVVHHNQKMMLNRELLYTAVTRASRRVLLLYTDHGLRIALKTQKISGATLPEKIRQYQELLGEGSGKNLFRTMNVRLFQDDAPSVDESNWDESDDPDSDYDEGDDSADIE